MPLDPDNGREDEMNDSLNVAAETLQGDDSCCLGGTGWDASAQPVDRGCRLALYTPALTAGPAVTPVLARSFPGAKYCSTSRPRSTTLRASRSSLTTSTIPARARPSQRLSPAGRLAEQALTFRASCGASYARSLRYTSYAAEYSITRATSEMNFSSCPARRRRWNPISIPEVIPPAVMMRP
jgi:hypothetical protein